MDAIERELELSIFGKVRAKRSKSRNIYSVVDKMTTPSVMGFESVVKITSYGTANAADGSKASNSRDHADYISRDSKLDVETDSGEVLKDKEAILEYFKDRDKRFFENKRFKNQRDTVNMVLSAPDQVLPQHVEAATREFAKRVFAGHRYVFVLHTKDTDPKQSTTTPHCHLDVECLSKNGQARLRINKTQLQYMREVYADILEEYGYMVNATPKKARGVTRQNISAAVKGMKDREAFYEMKGIKKSVFDRVKKVKTKTQEAAQEARDQLTKHETAKKYRKLAAELMKSPDKQTIGKKLHDFSYVVEQGGQAGKEISKDKNNDLER